MSQSDFKTGDPVVYQVPAKPTVRGTAWMIDPDITIIKVSDDVYSSFPTKDVSLDR